MQRAWAPLPCSPMQRMGGADNVVKPPEDLQHMHGMLKNDCRALWVFVLLGTGMSLRLFTLMPCPKFGARAKSGLTQHVVVGGVACASRTVCGTCAHVGGNQDSFLGVAVMQVHGGGGQVVLGLAVNMWRPGSVFVLLGAQWGSVPTRLLTGATVQQLGLSHGSHLQGRVE